MRMDLKRREIQTFSDSDQQTWKMLYAKLSPLRESQAHPLFVDGLRRLRITEDKIPNLLEVNTQLSQLTGWKAVPVEGLEEGQTFYPALSRCEFPIGNFIRDRRDLGYTPAPDIFHDLYGHIPFFVDKDYAQFCQKYGEMVSRHSENPQRLAQFERFFWFTIEFGLIEGPQGRRIFGGGILSSFDECQYALSDKPKVFPFDVKTICDQDFRIDTIQPVLFIMKSTGQLYHSLDNVEKYVCR